MSASENAGEIAWPSVNICKIGVDLLVSRSDGKPGSPASMKVLSLTWDEVIEMVDAKGSQLGSEPMALVSEAVRMSGDSR